MRRDVGEKSASRATHTHASFFAAADAFLWPRSRGCAREMATAEKKRSSAISSGREKNRLKGASGAPTSLSVYTHRAEKLPPPSSWTHVYDTHAHTDVYTLSHGWNALERYVHIYIYKTRPKLLCRSPLDIQVLRAYTPICTAAKARSRDRPALSAARD